MATVSQVNAGIAGICELCGFPPGQPGYVREEVAVGHPHFGRAIPCPKCNERKIVEAHLSRRQGFRPQSSIL